MFEPFYLIYLFYWGLLMVGFQYVKCSGVPMGLGEMLDSPSHTMWIPSDEGDSAS